MAGVVARAINSLLIKGNSPLPKGPRFQLWPRKIEEGEKEAIPKIHAGVKNKNYTLVEEREEACK